MYIMSKTIKLCFTFIYNVLRYNNVNCICHHYPCKGLHDPLSHQFESFFTDIDRFMLV